ncbi:MAG TPA: peptidase MA family metallohydrolase [Candidatus Binatia bacterium]|nr:peptidase MA family metallohydrolase [Candidatus Binatia bacterium]
MRPRGRTGSRRPRCPLAALAAALGLAIGLASPAPAVAADPTFQLATATSTFGDAITVEQRISLPAGVARVEAYVRTGGSPTTFLAEVDNPGPGNHLLRYAYNTPGGSLYPNTPVEIGFRVTNQDGTVVEGPPASLVYEDERFDWRTLEGDLVRIHWYEGNDDFGRRALRIGEEAVREATALLGVEERDPIDFFVYAGRDEFYDVLGNALQENVGGLALPEIRTLFANIAPSEVNDPWVSIVVPHELTHVVFDTATRNPYHEPPHWLNEGLADYLAQGYTAGARANVERAARDRELMPLHALSLRFPSTASRFSLGYDESVSAIDYLIRAHGQDALVRLIRSYADGVSDDAAFEAALGVDVAGFEAGWLGDLDAEVPVPYGPKAAPVGPLPPGWDAAPQQSVPPIVTPPPAPDTNDRAELGMTIAIGVIGLFGIVIVLGILVAARGLDRGETLMRQPTGSGLPPQARWADRDDEDRDDGDRGLGEPRPDEELEQEVSELDRRLAPPGEPGRGGGPGEPRARGDGR